jgi:hypothetical protein
MEAFAKNVDEKSFHNVVLEALHEFGEVFAKESFNTLPERTWDHAIELERKDELLTTQKVYPMSPEEQKELDAFLEEALSTGRIRPSKSPIGTPVFFIQKEKQQTLLRPRLLHAQCHHMKGSLPATPYR